jgi:hypothetical protein
MKPTIQKIVLILLGCLAPQVIFSQTPPPPTPPPPPGTPIDGGVVIMFFIALGLGYIMSKKYFNTKKSSI